MLKKHFIHSSLRLEITELMITHFSASPSLPEFQIIQEQGVPLNTQIIITVLLELIQEEKPWYYFHGIFITLKPRTLHNHWALHSPKQQFPTHNMQDNFCKNILSFFAVTVLTILVGVIAPYLRDVTHVRYLQRVLPCFVHGFGCVLLLLQTFPPFLILPAPCLTS